MERTGWGANRTCISWPVRPRGSGRALREQSRYKADEEVEEEKAALSVNRYWLFAAANPSIGGLVIGKRLLGIICSEDENRFSAGADRAEASARGWRRRRL